MTYLNTKAQIFENIAKTYEFFVQFFQKYHPYILLRNFSNILYTYFWKKCFLGTVTYSWSGIDPCPLTNSQCLECETYGSCKSGLRPACDGSNQVQCLTEEERAIFYDDESRVNYDGYTCQEELEYDASMCTP